MTRLHRPVDRLRHLIGLRRGAALLAAGLSWLSAFLLLSAACTLLDALLRLPAAFRYGLALLQNLLLVLLAARRQGPVRLLLVRHDPLADASRLDDRLRTHDLFVNTLSLHPRATHDPAVARLLAEAEDRLRTLRVHDWLDPKPLLRALRLLGLGLLPWTAALLLAPKETLYHAVRTVTPWSGREARLFGFNYTLEPGDTAVPAGGTVTVVLTASEPVASCRISSSSAGGRLSGEMASTDDPRRRLFTFRDILEDITYAVEMETARHGRRFATRAHTIRVLRPPRLTSFSVRYTYPGHIGWPSRTVQDSLDLEAPEGTVARLTASADQPLSRAFILTPEGRRAAKAEGHTLVADIPITSPSEYAVLLVARNGLTNADPVRHAIRPIPDRPPSVAITSPGEDVPVPPSMTLDVTVEAKDDYLLKLLELRVFRKDPYTARTFPTNRIGLLDAPAASARTVHTLGLAELGLNPGEVLHYFAVCDDGHPSGTHRVMTPVYTVRFPSLEEMHRAVGRALDETAETVRKAKELQAETLRRLDEIARRMERSDEIPYAERRRLEADLERQKTVLEELRSAAERLGEAAERMERERTQSREIARKVEEIRRLLEEVADEEMTRALRATEDLLNRVELGEEDRRRLAERLDRERLLGRLDNALRMLEELREARRLDEFGRRAERLVERQRELLERADSDRPAGDEETRGLANRQEEIRRELEGLLRDMDVLPETKEARDAARRQDLPAEMSAAADALRRRDSAEARRRQSRSLSGLMDLRQRLAEAGRRRERRVREETGRATADIWFQVAAAAAEWARILSETSTVRDLSPPFPSALPSAVRTLTPVEQAVAVERGLAIAKQQVRQALERTTAVDPEFYDRFDQAIHLVARTRELLGQNNTAQAGRNGRQALAILDRILLDLLELSARAGGQGQAGGEGGEGDMDDIVSGQEGINRTTQRLKGRSGPSGLDTADQELLKELAYQQELVRQAFERLLSDGDGEGAERTGRQEAGGLGDMSSVLRDMEKAAQKLRAGELDDELLRTQNRILQRMLDSQRGLRSREESQERKAERPTVTAPGRRPPPLPDETLRRTAEEPRPPERYPREYRSIVEQYLRSIAP